MHAPVERLSINTTASRAVRDYAKARELLEQAIATRASGADPMPLLLIRRNSWADPVYLTACRDLDLEAERRVVEAEGLVRGH